MLFERGPPRDEAESEAIVDHREPAAGQLGGADKLAGDVVAGKISTGTRCCCKLSALSSSGAVRAQGWVYFGSARNPETIDPPPPTDGVGLTTVRSMSVPGHTRHFDRAPLTSGSSLTSGQFQCPSACLMSANRYRNGLSVSLPLTPRWRRYFAFAPRNGKRSDHIASIGASIAGAWRLAHRDCDRLRHHRGHMRDVRPIFQRPRDHRMPRYVESQLAQVVIIRGLASEPPGSDPNGS